MSDFMQDGTDDATEADRLAGLVEQVRADLLLGTAADPVATLTARLKDAGIHLEGDAFDAALAQVTG